MPVAVRGRTDEALVQIQDALEDYESDHPSADIVIYRQNPAAIRVRVLDPDLAELDRTERHERVWSYLGGLPESTQGDITVLLLLTPDEAPSSFANLEFDNPVRSLR